MDEKELIKRAIELCLAVYRVTDKFPTKEILREKLRGASLDIIESVANDLINDPTRKGRLFNFQRLNLLLAYFEVAARQNWVDAKNFNTLIEAYRVMYDNYNNCQSKINAANRQGKAMDYLSKRQQNIIRCLEKQREGMSLADFSTALRLSKRTITRELSGLIKSGVVNKQGVTKGAKFIATFKTKLEHIVA